MRRQTKNRLENQKEQDMQVVSQEQQCVLQVLAQEDTLVAEGRRKGKGHPMVTAQLEVEFGHQRDL